MDLMIDPLYLRLVFDIAVSRILGSMMRRLILRHSMLTLVPKLFEHQLLLFQELLSLVLQSRSATRSSASVENRIRSVQLATVLLDTVLLLKLVATVFKSRKSLLLSLQVSKVLIVVHRLPVCINISSMITCCY